MGGSERDGTELHVGDYRPISTLRRSGINMKKRQEEVVMHFD